MATSYKGPRRDRPGAAFKGPPRDHAGAAFKAAAVSVKGPPVKHFEGLCQATDGNAYVTDGVCVTGNREYFPLTPLVIFISVLNNT